jgi:hypothetical protein
MNKKAEKANEPRTTSIFYTPTDTIRKFAYSLAEELENFDPIVRKLVASEVSL